MTANLARVGLSADLFRTVFSDQVVVDANTSSALLNRKIDFTFREAESVNGGALSEQLSNWLIPELQKLQDFVCSAPASIL